MNHWQLTTKVNIYDKMNLSILIEVVIFFSVLQTTQNLNISSKIWSKKTKVKKMAKKENENSYSSWKKKKDRS